LEMPQGQALMKTNEIGGASSPTQGSLRTLSSSLEFTEGHQVVMNRSPAVKTATTTSFKAYFEYTNIVYRPKLEESHEMAHSQAGFRHRIIRDCSSSGIFYNSDKTLLLTVISPSLISLRRPPRRTPICVIRVDRTHQPRRQSFQPARFLRSLCHGQQETMEQDAAKDQGTSLRVPCLPQG